uniref:Small-conductance mechanosensitive channel MscMJ n=1 Tax=Candidatus Methanophagaceae archaeon ANME-1 ERB6 TaxID=2759912 RepID=A0A7G9YYK1_9EURY|nr:small-conductance mechanosensitive channel MscMJ [Methanosarcinales archaeon ANME-1 ERB6]
MDLQNLQDILLTWFLSHGIKIIAILIGAYLISHFGKIFIEKTVRKLIKPEKEAKDPEAEKKREDTLIKAFNSTLSLVVWIAAIFMIIYEFEINIGPLLVGAGVIGVALGFGFQHIIKDFLAGIFIIVEDQYRVGDVVNVANVGGLVQDISLRKTVLRDLDGVEHHIANGEIRKASNLSKGFARVNLNIGVAYKENLEHVIEVVNRVGKELAEDSEWKEKIVTVPQFLRVDDFADSAIIIKLLGDTKPLKQWEVKGELRKRLKIAFDEENIEIPFPQMSVWPRGKCE